MRHTLALAAVALLAGCASPPPAPLGPAPTDPVPGPALNSEQIRQEIVGNTGTGTRTGTTSTWTIYAAPDGTLKSRLPTGTETGRWRISDDGRFCFTIPGDFNGRETCQSVHKAGVGVELRSLESVERMVFQAGNKM